MEPAGRPVAVWLVTRIALLLAVFHPPWFPGVDVSVDVSVVYHDWFQVLSTGTFPLDDDTWQYPPGAAMAIMAPGVLSFLDYFTAFVVLTATVDAAVFAMLLRAGNHATDADGSSRSYAGAWMWCVGVPLLGPTAYARYDLMVTGVAVAALLAMKRSAVFAGVLTGLGAMLKVWPALVLIGSAKGAVTRRAWASGATTVAALAIGIGVAMSGAFAFLRFQRERGIEIESVPALVFHLARQVGWDGRVEFRYGSLEFIGPHVETVAMLSLFVSMAAFGWLVLWRVRAGGTYPAVHYDAALAAVLLFVVTSRVLSPQYLVWLLGLGAVCLTLRSTVMRTPAALVLGAAVLTMLEFPVLFDHVIASDALGLGLMLSRNGLLLAAAVLACRNVWRSVSRLPSRQTSAIAR